MLFSLHFECLFQIHCPLIFSIFFISAVVSRIWQLGAFLLDLHQLHPIINYRVKMIGWFLCICTATGVCYYQPNMFILNTRPVLLKYKAPSWKATAVVISEWLTKRMFCDLSSIPRTPQNPFCSLVTSAASWDWGILGAWVVLPLAHSTPSELHSTWSTTQKLFFLYSFTVW